MRGTRGREEGSSQASPVKSVFLSHTVLLDASFRTHAALFWGMCCSFESHCRMSVLVAGSREGEV